MKKIKTLKELYDCGVIAILRANGLDDALLIVENCLKGGVKAIELTFTTPNADVCIRELSEKFRDEIVLGAGTVLDDITARIAILAGAKYIVSPNFKKSIARICARYSVLYFPGCFTLSEMVNALEVGVDVVKLFPCSNLTPNFIKSIKAPLPNINVIPSGGINVSNMLSWLDSGAFAIGIGSDLTSGIARDGYSYVEKKAKEYVSEFLKAKNRNLL